MFPLLRNRLAFFVAVAQNTMFVSFCDVQAELLRGVAFFQSTMAWANAAANTQVRRYSVVVLLTFVFVAGFSVRDVIDGLLMFSGVPGWPARSNCMARLLAA